jgi:TolB protein
VDRAELLPAAALGLLLVPGSAEAAFPGHNGKIVFVSGGTIYTINPDGTNRTPFAAGWNPAWSPDGTKIAFVRSDGIYVGDTDGTPPALVVQGPRLVSPEWSPDGTRLAYVQLGTCSTAGCGRNILYVADADGADATAILGAPDVVDHVDWSPDGQRFVMRNAGSPECFADCEQVFRMNVDGSQRVRLTPQTTRGHFPDWSPDGTQIVFSYYREAIARWGVATMVPNPGAPIQVVRNDAAFSSQAWSPDGTRIAFSEMQCTPANPPDPPVCTGDVFVMDADGSAVTQITEDTAPEGGVDWQSIPVTAYPRPKSATPMQVSLVPTYEACTSPNRTHGPPLAFGSCNPPQPRSSTLTIGTPDANGQAPKSQADVWLRVLPGNPATPADEADVRLSGSITDVRVASDLSDYTGALEARVTLRITDKDNTPDPGGAGVATVEDLAYSFPISCAATSDTTVGGACTFDTTADALVPGTARERTRAIWELGQLAIHDANGGAFMRQGIFVP